MTRDWLDNPYRSIIEYAQMFVRQNRTVDEALDELETMLKSGGAQNEVAEKRIANAKRFVAEEFPEDIRKEGDANVQFAIALAMKLRLNTKYPD